MTTDQNAPIAILGITDKEDRYAHIAYKTLLEKGYRNLTGITPKELKLPQINIVQTIDDVKAEIHTLTLYVGAKRLEPMIDQILSLKPNRIILNPGTENPELIKRANELGIETIEGCTIVMLNTNQF